MLYCLSFLWAIGLIFSFFGIMPFDPLNLIFSLFLILIFSLLINRIFSWLFKTHSNVESTYITALILALIIGPEKSLNGFLFLIFVSAIAIASKYLLAINKKHIFNPAAFAVVVSAYVVNYYPSWWIGDKHMIIFVLLLGILIVIKLQRTDLVLSFLIVFIITSSGFTTSWQQIFSLVKDSLSYSPILFFAFIMLTEPATTPPTRKLRIIYGSLVALLIAPFVHISSVYFVFESALVLGNVFSYLVSPKEKLILKLKEKIKIAQNTYDFVFPIRQKLKFQPGQYMEWTLPAQKNDSRGQRRYFTIASSPTEQEIKIGVKFYENPSSFKKALQSLNKGDEVVAGQLAGEFTLPNDKNKKLVFVAGGIGVTPFRSMVKYLTDNNEKRDIIIFYAAKTYGDIAYKEIFEEAQNKLGIKTVYVLSDAKGAPKGFNCETGFLTKEIIFKNVKDFQERKFYISGPKSMIDSFKITLKEMKVRKNNIKTDFFPGYA